MEGLADLADQRAAGHRNDDIVGETPSELLGDLVAYGLRALGVVGAKIYVDQTPVVLVRNQRAEAVDVVVVAVDANKARAVYLGVENLCGLEIRRHENAGLDAETGCLRGDRVGEVAGGGGTDSLKAKALSIGQGDGDDAVFEAERREADGVILDVEIGCADALAEILCPDERSEADRQIRQEAIWDGKKRSVAPDVGRAGCDRLAGEDTAYSLKIVGNLEGDHAVRAAPPRLVAVPFATLIALQLIPRIGIVHYALSEGKEELFLMTYSLLGAAVTGEEGEMRGAVPESGCVLRISCSLSPGES